MGFSSRSVIAIFCSLVCVPIDTFLYINPVGVSGTVPLWDLLVRSCKAEPRWMLPEAARSKPRISLYDNSLKHHYSIFSWLPVFETVLRAALVVFKRFSRKHFSSLFPKVNARFCSKKKKGGK